MLSGRPAFVADDIKFDLNCGELLKIIFSNLELFWHVSPMISIQKKTTKI